MHHRTPLMVVTLSLALLACGDEDDDYAKKNQDGGRPRSSSGKPRTGPDDGKEDAGEDPEPGDLDGGAPDELDGSSSAADGAPPAGDAGGDSGRDAGADAEPTGSDGGGVCADPGESCETLDCCSGATCIIEPETGDPICAAECAEPSECNSECCVSVRDADLGACVPARYCEAPPVPMGSGCDSLVLIAEDGTFLGNAASSSVATNGVCNQVSPHGSSVGASSIFNAVGTYGSTVSAQSAYSSTTSTPPALFCAESDELVAFVTKNQLVTGAPLVDPDALCVVLEDSGF